MIELWLWPPQITFPATQLSHSIFYSISNLPLAYSDFEEKRTRIHRIEWMIALFSLGPRCSSLQFGFWWFDSYALNLPPYGTILCSHPLSWTIYILIFVSNGFLHSLQLLQIPFLSYFFPLAHWFPSCWFPQSYPITLNLKRLLSLIPQCFWKPLCSKSWDVFWLHGAFSWIENLSHPVTCKLLDHQSDISYFLIRKWKDLF